MAVRYYTDDCRYRLPQKRLTAQWLRGVAAAEGYTLGDVSYVFCSAQRLLEMNRQYLGHDYFTDVITFDYSDRRGTHVVSGDIFIDVETVRDNARLYGARPLDEMRRVVVHGVLHLCGQGDKTPRTNAQMHRKEDRYLRFWEACGRPGQSPEGTPARPAKEAETARKGPKPDR
ncbi:MAG TPA: rRNA maturation RNase YbeY [Candidatus Alistipes stercoravium]|nr:rRNA maturation RNase YbeY [Candidatus Alistipes stercoravium]